MNIQWTPEREAQLVTYWSQGLTLNQIASQMGDDVTRNSVVGKVHRMGLEGRRVVAFGAAPCRELKAPKMPFKDTFSAETVVMDTFFPSNDQNCTLMQLTNQTCRWPFGDPATENFYFCGAVPVDGKPYCGCHAALSRK